MRKFSAAEILVGAVVAASGGTTVTMAEPVVTQKISYYDVTGTTAHQIRADLNRRGPLGLQGKRFDGFTRWHVKWRYTYNSVSQRCAIARATTTVDIVMTLPRLSADADASVELKLLFSDYIAKLRVHENGHAQIAIDIAKRIEAGIGAIPPETTCEKLGQVANNLGHSLIKEANQQDIDYDARTQHGRTQGARFP